MGRADDASAATTGLLTVRTLDSATVRTLHEDVRFRTTHERLTLFALTSTVTADDVAIVTDDGRTIARERRTTVYTVERIERIGRRRVGDTGVTSSLSVFDFDHQLADIVGDDRGPDRDGVDVHGVPRACFFDLFLLFVPEALLLLLELGSE
jgi:hypothetical protein